MRGILRKVFLEDALLKTFSLCIAVVLFLVRSNLDAYASAYVRLHYVVPKDRVLVSELPSEVKVVLRGPWSRVSRQVDEERLPSIQIDLARQGDGELRFTDDMLQLPPGLRVGGFTPSSINLRSEPRLERAVPVQVIIDGEPHSGYRVAGSVAKPQVVRVTGAKSAVEGLRNAPTMPLRVTGLTSPVEMTVRLAALPPHVSYLERTDLAVSVAVSVERMILERTYSEVAIKVQGAAPELVKLQPEVAQVVLRGPALALEQVRGTPELTVDASAEERKPAGTYRKRLQVVNLPPDIAAEVRPGSVQLTLTKPAAPAPPPRAPARR